MTTTSDVIKFEALHSALTESRGYISKAIELLNSNPLTKGMDWTYEVLEKIMESQEYLKWKASAKTILMNHADVEAVRRVAYSDELSDQARATIAVALIKGDTGKARKVAARSQSDRAVDDAVSDLPDDAADKIKGWMEEDE